MYANTDSTDYAQVYNSRTSTTSYYIYIRGFNFDAIPAHAVVNSFTVKLKGNYSGGYSQNMYLYDGTSTQMGSGSSLSSSVHTVTFDCSATWEEVVNAGSDFGIRINCRRSSRNTAAYFYIYGAEIEVDYTIPNPRTLNVSATGNGTVTPSGTSTVYDGDEIEININPTNKSDTVTATHNGTDVTSQLVAHGTESSAQFTASDHITSGIQSGGSYAAYCIGHTAENPSTSGTSSNMYSSSGSTGYAEYSFDFSAIPSNAVIEDIEVKAYGHRENSTIDSSHVSQCVLHRGSTAISEETDFPSTSNSIITITPTDIPTRSELDSVTLRHYVGYYGGLVLGITFTVTYSTGTGLDHYTYTFTVSADASIVVTIGTATGPRLFININGTAKEYTKAYRNVNGQAVEIALNQAFDSSKKYRYGGNV